ncbi:MAG: hypothetical protein ACI30R_03050 [Sodaliphilus sp.]
MKQIIKGIFIALLASVAFNAMAWEKPEFNFYFKDFAIKPGETKQIQLYLKNNFLGRDFQLQVYFPEGLKPVLQSTDPEDPDADYVYFVNINRAKTCSFSEAYVESLGRLRLISVNMKGQSKFTAGDAAIATLCVQADENYDGKQMIVFGNEVKSETVTNPYINKLNYDTVYSDGTKGVITISAEEVSCPVYPAKTIAWLNANGVEGGEYGLADAVAVMNEGALGKFVQDADHNAFRVEANTTWSLSGAAAETICGVFHKTNGNPYLAVADGKPAPDADASVTGAVKKTTLNNVLFNPEPNEVVTFGGYYREADNTICAYKTDGDQGQCIPIDWSLYSAVSPVEGVQLANAAGVADGSYLSVTGPVLQKMTWEEAEQTAGMTGKEGPGAWKNYIIYPTAISTDIPTGVDDINAKTVAGVKYVNTLGVESTTPFSGVNIVVTTYTDGSVSAVKVVK